MGALRTIQEILDLQSGSFINSTYFFNRPEEEIFKDRYVFETHIQKKKKRFVCPFCKEHIKIRGGGSEKVIMHFAHLKDSKDCPIKTNNRYTKEEIERVKYNGVKESDLHYKLKNRIAAYLRQNEKNEKGVENVEVETVHKDQVISATWRKPDVTALYFSKKLAIELQLSTTFLSVIVGREEFYKRNETFILWVFNSFETKADKRKFTQSDVFYNKKQNGFEFNEKAQRLSHERNDLILCCHFEKPKIENYKITTTFAHEYVSLSDLTFDTNTYKVFYYDVELEKDKLKRKLAIINSLFLKTISGGNVNSYFKQLDFSDPETSKEILLHFFSERVSPTNYQAAKEILLKTKLVNTPRLYKYSPFEEEDEPYLIEEAQYVKVHDAIENLTFYEDEESNIGYTQNPDFEEENVLFKPDITFFNKEDQPILLIKLSTTLYIPDDELIRLKYLGIDTIHIPVPLSTASQKAKLYYNKTQQIKWIYNHVQETTEYIPNPGDPSEELPFIDEEQRFLFDESTEFRAERIRFFIQRFVRHLESKSYRDILTEYKGQIQKIEEDTRRDQERLEELRKRFGGGIRGRFEEARREFEEKYDDYTDRCEVKRAENERSARDIELRRGAIEERRSVIEERRGTIEERRSVIRERRTGVESRLGSAKAGLEEIQQDCEKLPGEFRVEEERITEEFKNEGNQLEKKFKTDEIRLREQFKSLRVQADETVFSRNFTGDTRMSERLKRLVAVRKSITDYINALPSYQRYERAKRLFKGKSYENWQD